MGISEVLSGQAQWHIERGDVRSVLQSMPDKCVQTIVTSPPY
jgi:hypothetical protein